MLAKGSLTLFQGDSITDGARSRNDDWNHLLGHGYAYIVAARLGAESPELGLRFANRGASGHRVVDLYARWQEDAIALAPDVLSVMVGINDVGAGISGSGGVSAERFEKVYRMMLQETVEALPRVRIVLCDPFVLPVGATKERWPEWRAEVDRRIECVARLAREFGAVRVRGQELLNHALERAPAEYWLWDGVHPMPAGHELLARAWIDAVAGLAAARR
jgi:lysophospholipase L1-like esterase